MRKLILIADDLYVRSFVETGALDAVADGQTSFAATSAVSRLDALPDEAAGNLIALDERRERRLGWYRAVAMAAMRKRSETMRLKTELDLGPRRRLAAKFLALPWVWPLARRVLLWRAGRGEAVAAVIDRVQPDLIIAPTAGTDSAVWDAIVAARRAGARSLVLINGWDNLSSKSVFPELPDYMGVWGPQAAGQAHVIHGMAGDRTFELGVPTFHGHFGFQPGDQSPYPFPYVLFAGCALPFDELSALHVLDRAVAESEREDLRIVYRPHPWRHPRSCPDVFDPAHFESVVIDRQLATGYALSVERGSVGPSEVLPELDQYPALLGNAEMVVCPLSTMIIEALIVKKRVLTLTYDDGVHRIPPNTVVRFSHFAGIEQTEGIHLCAEAGDLERDFLDTLASGDPSSREGVRQWLHFDDDAYATRLARAVSSIERDGS